VVLKRQLALRAELLHKGKIDHDCLFFKASGAAFRNLQYPHKRWQQTLSRLPSLRYRKPYAARHTSVSWELMMGRSALWAARQHGHKHRHDAALLRRLGARGARAGHFGRPSRGERGTTGASAMDPARPSKNDRLRRKTVRNGVPAGN
jgi:hypothetical protein